MPYADPLTEDELATALAGLPDWSRDGTIIRRSAKVAGFRAAVGLVNDVADAAEAADHHPDICISGYRNVSFELTTHAAKALTRRDIELAAEIDRLIIEAHP